ncbi:MAG: hypothetical protein HW416_3402 [Chloroflexi bacterium]|nr:hypothetical protein [Chloroflexota bacterium]
MVISRQLMAAYEPYVRSLEMLAGTVLNGRKPPIEEKDFAALLDGHPGSRLRDLIPLATRKASGAFFTGSTLASRAMDQIAHTIGPQSILLDPTCGVGDLLVAAARHLPVDVDLGVTITKWGRQIHGFDIFPEFVRAAKARLVLLASTTNGSSAHEPALNCPDTFPGLAVGDGIGATVLASRASHILLNPPYPRVPAPKGCAWGSGQVSQAAVFLDACLEAATPGARIVAILPDVLRTGSLYARWRAMVEARAGVDSVQVYGAFDAWADVDVFVLHLIVGSGNPTVNVAWWRPAEAAATGRVSEHFDVHVGPVVPHRHKGRGTWHPYVYASRLPAWEEFESDESGKRRFVGRTFVPPFVTVRRTSAPRDQRRAVGTIVNGKRPVAVENHLLVLVPRDSDLERCHQLLTVLRDQRTSDWLNERIRCRHLTVGALRELPWWSPPSEQ